MDPCSVGSSRVSRWIWRRALVSEKYCNKFSCPTRSSIAGRISAEDVLAAVAEVVVVFDDDDGDDDMMLMVMLMITFVCKISM